MVRISLIFSMKCSPKHFIYSIDKQKWLKHFVFLYTDTFLKILGLFGKEAEGVREQEGQA